MAWQRFAVIIDLGEELLIITVEMRGMYFGGAQRVADKEGSKYRNLQSDCLNPFRFEPNLLDDEQQPSGVDF